MADYIKLDGTTIKFPNAPSGFTIERYMLTKSGRVATGMMVMDFIAQKRKFLLKYSSISAEDLKVITDITDDPKMFFTFEYVEGGTVKTCTVYAGHVPAPRYRTGYYKDVQIDFIEQ